MAVVGAVGTCVTTHVGAAFHGQPARRQVMVGGRRVIVVDGHAHCVIPVQDIVTGSPLAKMGGGGGNNVLGPQRLQIMILSGNLMKLLRIS